MTELVTQEEVSPERDLNPRSVPYKGTALARLSHRGGLLTSKMIQLRVKYVNLVRPEIVQQMLKVIHRNTSVMSGDLEPEYAKFVGNPFMETRELLDDEKSLIDELNGERYGDGVVFDYDEFLEVAGSDESYRWTEQSGVDSIAVAETENDLRRTIELYLEDSRNVLTSNDFGKPMGTCSRY